MNRERSELQYKIQATTLKSSAFDSEREALVSKIQSLEMQLSEWSSRVKSLSEEKDELKAQWRRRQEELEYSVEQRVKESESRWKLKLEQEHGAREQLRAGIERELEASYRWRLEQAEN